MSEEDRWYNAIAKGERAQLVAEDLRERFNDVERELFEMLAGVNIHDQHSKDELLRSIKNLRRVRDAIAADVSAGQVAAMMVARSKKDRLKSLIGW